MRPARYKLANPALMFALLPSSTASAIAGFLHIHHGEEAFYFVEGGTVETPDGKQMSMPTGTAGNNRRDVPHGAFKVVGPGP